MASMREEGPPSLDMHFKMQENDMISLASSVNVSSSPLMDEENIEGGWSRDAETSGPFT